MDADQKQLDEADLLRLKKLPRKLVQLAEFFEENFPDDTEDGREDLRWLSEQLPKLLEELEELKSFNNDHQACRCNPIYSGEEYCNGGCAIRKQLAQAQAEVERLTLFIEIDIPRIVTSRLNELKQALSPQEAKDDRD